MVRLKRSAVVALFVAIGFPKAAGWTEAQLLNRTNKIPDNVDEDDVPEEHLDLFEKIVQAVSDEEKFDFIDDDDDEDAPPSIEDINKMSKKDLGRVIKDFDLPKPGKKDTLDMVRKAVIAELHGAGEGDEEDPAEDEKPKSSKKEEKPKKAAVGKKEEKKATPEVDRDEFGSKPGTISHAVNAALAREWKTEEEIVKESGISLTQVRDRLYYLTEQGKVEKEVIRRFRVKS